MDEIRKRLTIILLAAVFASLVACDSPDMERPPDIPVENFN